MRYRIYALFIITCALLVSIIGYIGVNVVYNSSPLRQIQTAQEIAKLSGQYQFHSEIDQISDYAPRITNYARPSRHDQLVIDGSINESLQTSTLTIANANGIMLEIRRERGVTYARQSGTGWQRTNSNNTAQVNTLSYLAGMTHAAVNPQRANSYDFDFDGLAFTEHFARLLNADAAHGINYNQEWYTIANSSQFKKATGNGQLTLDSDGLPDTMALQLTIPASDRAGSVQTSIKTTFFAYARTGLALQKLVNNPLLIIGNMLGTDSSAIQNILFGMLAIMAVSIIGGLVHLFRTRLYLPITLLALGMMVFQPFSNIPHSLAATNQTTNPPPGPDTTTTTTTDPPSFNPLISPLQQFSGIALPSAGVQRSSTTVIATQANSRALGSSRAGSSDLDSDKDGLADSEEQLRGTNINLADTDGDGLNDYDEVKLGTNPLRADSDNDGLNDFAETQLGTNPNSADTDHDGLSDLVEVTKFTQYTGSSNKFYTNPLSADTNHDGTNDLVECPQKLITASEPCTDTNHDGVPDFLSFDNDGDKVPDNYDLSPNDTSSGTYSNAKPFTYKIQNTTSSIKPLTVDMQIRPSNDALLYANNAIYDWPSNDSAGQVTRVRNTTFQSSSVFNATDATASNGDIKVTAMLEIRIPVSSGQYGNLPVTACLGSTNEVKLNSADANSCIDSTKTRPYGMSIGWSRDEQGNTKSNEISVSLPLNPDYDQSGTIVAYSTKMYYMTSAQPWVNDHQVRLQWIISSIQDSCPASKPDCAPNERIEYSSLLQSYYSDWSLIGMQATENLGVKASLIYEDITKADITDNGKRRLAITQNANFLKSNFVNLPFLQLDGNDNDKSIAVLFDNTKNSAAAVSTANYGLNKNATRVSSFTYPTMLDMVAINSTEIPKVLNNSLCRKNGKADDCAEKTTLRTGCENNTSVACRPAIIIATETNERSVGLSFSTNSINFQNQEVIVSRTANGIIYGINAGQWVALTSNNDMSTEMAAIQQQFVKPTTPTTLTDQEWNTFNQSLLFSSMALFGQPQVRGYQQSQIPNILLGITKGSFNATAKTTWGDEVADVYAIYATVVNARFAKLRIASSTIQPNTNTQLNSAVSATELSSEVIDDISGIFDDLSGMNAKNKLSLVFAALSIANTLFSVGSTFDKSGRISPEVQSLVINTITLTASIYSLVKESMDVAKALKAVNGVMSKAVEAAKAAKSVAVAGKFAKFMKVLGPVMIAIAIAATWAVGIMTAMNAEYGWQKGNAIASMIGQTIAILFILALTSIPVIGQLIGAVIAVLDAIAAIACAQLSEKQQRSTAGKWLCGGISGVLANLFTPYASNIVVDPDDPWSRYMKVAGTEPKISTPIDGFRVGNGMVNGLKVTDYIERMPFPSTWMALPWFWQWKKQDTRDASFTYALGSDQKDMSYSIATGGQFGQWQGNAACDMTLPSCDYYVDGEKTYTWRKSMTVNYTSPFTRTGINVTMTDLWLSTAFKVPQQTCIAVPIFVPFPIPIPICWIETHTGHPKYININEDSKIKYDILPATIDEFVSLRPKGNGFTFGWSTDSDTPAFPVFVDADNDGLTVAQEVKNNTRDNSYDSDDDGISDNREVGLGTPANNADSDNDGLSDAEEIQFGTNPLKPDTDGDGLLDGEEVVRVDSKTHLLTGGWEVTYAIVNGVPQNTWISSDPLSADSDQDGIIDLREKILGWSPYGKNSGEILAVNGTVREALLPLLQTGFETQGNNSFTSSGVASTNLRCVPTCPSVTASASDRLNNPSLTLNGAQSLDLGNGIQSTFNSQFTLSTWLKPTNNALQTIFSQSGLLGIFRTATGNIRVRLFTNQTVWDWTSPAIVPLNSWSHLAVTFGNKTVVIYVNGVEVSRVDAPDRLTDSDTKSNNLLVGPAISAMSSAYTGGLDDLAIFQVALRAGEVQQLYTGALPNSSDLIVRPGDRIVYSINETNKLLGRSMQGFTSVTGISTLNGFTTTNVVPMSMAANATTAFDGVIELPGAINTSTAPSTYTNSCVFGASELCVKFDEANPTIPIKFNDVSANASGLTCNSTAACPVYNGTDGSWKFNNTTTLQTTAAVGNAISNHDFTISVWVRPEGQSVTTRTIVNSSNTNANLQVALNQERPQITIGTAVLTAPNQLPLETWSHLVFVLANQQRQIYVNGSLVASDSSAISYPGAFGILRIGKDAGTNSLAGSLRDIQISSNALTPTQILSLTNTCEDPLLIICMPLTSNTNEFSQYGINQNFALIDGSASAFSTSAKFPDGFANLLSSHDFSVVAKVKLSAATQTILQTGTKVGSGNQFKLSVENGLPTLAIGSKSVTAGSMIVGSWYLVSARVNAGKLTLRIDSADGTVAQQQTSSDALLQGQDPFSLGATGMDIDNLRIYRIAISDSTIAGIARYALNNKPTVAINQAPVSDQLQVDVDARPKLIVPDPNFERLRGMCDAPSAVLCLPFDTANYGTNASYTLAPGVSIQQSTEDVGGSQFPAKNAIDNNLSNFSHNNWHGRSGVSGNEDKPWIEIDLNAYKEVQSVTVMNRTDCCMERMQTALVFLSNFSWGDSRDIVGMINSAPTMWRNLQCDNQDKNCTKPNTDMYTVNFPKGTGAHYIRIQKQTNNWLHMREIYVNGELASCEQANTCPVMREGGTEFIDQKNIALSRTLSKSVFEGVKDYTVMGWFRFNEPGNNSPIFGDNYDLTTANNQLQFGVNGNRVYMTLGGSSIFYSPYNTILPNKWYHIAFVKTGPARYVYVNGKQVINATSSPPPNLTSVRQMSIGALLQKNTNWTNGYYPTPSLNGTIRDFQIHNQGLTVAQIASAANVPTFELRIPFDEPAVSTSFSDMNTRAFGLECVTQCPLSGIPGRDDRAVHFDGNQSLRVTNSTFQYVSYIGGTYSDSVFGSRPKELTVGVWVRPSKYNTWIIGNNDPSESLRVGIDTNGYVTYERAIPCNRVNNDWKYYGTTMCWPYVPLRSTTKVPLNTWSYIQVSTEITYDNFWYSWQQNAGSFTQNEYLYVNQNGVSRTVSGSTQYGYRSYYVVFNTNSLVIAANYAGDMDDLRISPTKSTTLDDVNAQMNLAPNWNLNFEDTVSSNKISVSDGITKTTQIDSVILPDDVPGQSGIQRFKFAASCAPAEIAAIECPVGNAVGMAGVADLFNGKNTMLQVSNGISLTNEIANGGTIQLMIKPDSSTGTQTLLAYGNTSGANAWQVQIVDGKVRFSLGTRTFTASTKLANAWNHVSFKFTTADLTSSFIVGDKVLPPFAYFQNGSEDTAVVDSGGGLRITSALVTNSSYKLRIGGKISGSSLVEMFKGGIDDITLTPSSLVNPKIFRIARSQFAQAFSKDTIANFTLDADVPTIQISNPVYVARLPQQFIINTSDASSLVTRVTAAITSTLSSTGSILSKPTSNTITVPACQDAVGGRAYCPTFAVNQVANAVVEGKYGIVVNVYDSVDNMGSSQSTVLVDTTPPSKDTVALIRPSGTYTTTKAVNQNTPQILVKISASDPVLTNSGNSPGSGVVSLNVNIKDMSGRTINLTPIAATKVGNTWVSRIPLPFGNPSGFYQLGALATDAMGNQSSEIIVADEANPIEVDGNAPNDTIDYPSPSNPDNYFVGSQALSGRVSDYTDGRAPLQTGLRIRLDFEAPDGAAIFDNRADARYTANCTICPIIAADTVDTTRRAARFNIDAPQQALTIANAATVLTGTFSIAFSAKIVDSGTMVSTGIASNPRLRIKADKAGTTFKVTAQRGTTSVVTPATLTANTWYYFIYSEYRNAGVTTISLSYGTNLRTMAANPTTSTFTKAITNGALTTVSDIILGAMQSSTLTTAKEDYFRGSLDDFIQTSAFLTPLDLLGKSISRGSTVLQHQTRLAIDEDGMTNADGLAAVADFYLPINQDTLPVVDSINGTRSTRCTAGKTIDTSTCPTIADGFSSNALQLLNSSDGIQTGYILRSSDGISKSVALRFALNKTTTSGVLAWLQAPALTNSLAMQVEFDQALQRLVVKINDQTTTLLSADESAMLINDSNWHTLVLTSVGTSTGENISLFLDTKQLINSKAVVGHWDSALLGIGALTGVAGYSGRGTTSTAAVSSMIDDVAVFNSALSLGNVIDYSLGYGTVLYAPLDDANVTGGAQFRDDSPYHLAGTVTSGDTSVKSVVGSIGTAAMNFDGNDTVVFRDDNGQTFAPRNQPWSLSTWVTPKLASQSQTIVQGLANGYGYTLTLDVGRPRFVMDGIDLLASNQISTTEASNIVVTANGSNWTMLVNGNNVAAASVAAGTSFPSSITKTLSFTNQQQSSTVNAANLANDASNDTYSKTNPDNNPYWMASNPNGSEPIHQMVITARANTAVPLQNFYVFVYGTLATPTGWDSIAKLKQTATWYYYQTDVVNDHVVIPLPAGILGSNVRIVAEGNNRVLALSDVQIQQLPEVRIGAGFTGVIDDVRIYRRTLTNDDITRLRAMAWRTSTLTERIDGYSWQQSQIAGIEANANLQSMTSDRNGNSLLNSGETPLWNGSIDTLAPRITTAINNGTYTMSIADRNLDINQIATPCGSTLSVTAQQPNSLWFLQHMSVLDGTFSPLVNINGECSVSNSPELVRSNSQVISQTTALVYGSRYAYLGGNNQLAIVDVRPGKSMLLRTIATTGTITQLAVNAPKTLLYALSTQASQSILTIYNIATNPLVPSKVGTLAIDMATGVTFSDVGIASNNGADTFVMLLDSSSPQNIVSINVSNPATPVRGVSTVNDGAWIYDMAVQNDLLVFAREIGGVGINRIGNFGNLDALDQYLTDGYAHKVFFNNRDLLILDDDEAYDGTTAPTSANTLITVPLIDSLVDGKANLVSPLTKRSEYNHSTPIDGDSVNWYRIYDVVPYFNNEIMLLSGNLTPTSNQRISIINTLTNPASLVSDTRLNGSEAIRIASNGQQAVVLNKQLTTVNLTGYQVSDARLSTYACDQRNNCTTVTSPSSTPITLGQDPPVQNSVHILNQTNNFTTATQTVYVSAESTTGISTILLRANNQIVASVPISPTLQRAEAEFNLSLPSGVYTLTAQLRDTQPVTTTSAVRKTAVDVTAPLVKVVDAILGNTQLVNELFVIRLVITDDIGLDNLQIINKLTNANIPYTSKRRAYNNSCRCVVSDITITYNRRASDASGLPVRIIANDNAGRSTTVDTTIIFDTAPPLISNPTINATINGAATVLQAEQVVTMTTSANLNVAWSKVSDVSNITLHQVEYKVKTVSGTSAYTSTLAASGFSSAAGNSAITNSPEASRLTAAMRTRDILGNEGMTALPPIYIDTPKTPDYTLLSGDDPTYRGFLSNGCAVLGEDRRPTNLDIQRFGMTWDSQALRFNWQGADWEYDGDLFIYLDSKVGGTVKTYRPSNYTQTISDSVSLGESYITLPVNTAARGYAATSSLAAYVNAFQTKLVQSQQGIRTSSTQGSDYVLHIQNRSVAQILRWNDATDSWVSDGEVPSYRYADELGIKQTDIRVRFDQIGYTVGNPFGVVAFAVAPNKFMPWATFPSTNPIRTEQGSDAIVITPMLNGYGWSNLGANVCPNTAVLNPDTTRVIATLTSTPNGVFQRAIADNFANTEPDAITQIISETNSLCNALTNNSWCTNVAQYAITNNQGSALLDSLGSRLRSEQDPVVGNGSVVTYTLTIQNPTTKKTRAMYAIVQTYGGVWLTDGNSSGTPPVAIIGGGNYDYYDIPVGSGLRDYHLIRFNPIDANSSQTFSFRAKIDPNKAQANSSDRIKTSAIAKIEVRLTDDGTATNINQARTVEWLNAAVAIDTAPPSQILPDNQAIIKRGALSVTGNVTDASAVSAVQMEYTTNDNSTATQIDCGAAVNGRWACPITLANTVTQLSYRLRASDVYNQQSDWTAWYGAVVDSTPPTLSFSPQTESMVAAAYVGGSAISIGGLISDTLNQATVKICDEDQGTCENATTTTTASATPDDISASSSPNSAVTAQPCASSDIADYTAFLISQTNAATNARVSSTTVDVKVTSAAAHTLNLWLKSPSGTLVPLLTSLRPAATNLHALFADDGLISTTSQTGTVDINGAATSVRPDSPLTILNGEPINGTWQLLGCDRNEDSVRSTINQWTLTFGQATTAVSNGAPWSYTIKNSDNEDNILRVLKVRGIDATDNATATNVIRLHIDTVAPSLTINQLATAILPGTQATLFNGTASEGGTLSSITANVYDRTRLVKTIAIDAQSTQSQELARWNYLLGRSISAFTWELPFDATSFSTGTYQIQFVIVDAAGNQRTSDSYTFTIPVVTTPSITDIAQPAMHQANTMALNYTVDTGSGATSVDATFDFDGGITAPITDTTLRMWNSTGVADTVAQNQITTTLQANLFSQIAMNDHLAATLDTNGNLNAWELSGNTVNITSTIPAVQQMALGASSNQHLLTLSTTGIITDYTPSGVTTVPINGTAVAIAAGTTHNLAILKSGQVYAWGSNTNNEISATITDTLIITPTATGIMGATQIAAGNNFSLALKSDGRLVAWGKNNVGQTTVPISATSNIIQVAAGDSHVLALRADGVVIAWGSNGSGQTTVPISATNVIYIAANANSSAAITRDGAVYVWGATTLNSDCCLGTTTIALNASQILTNQMSARQQQSRSFTATVDKIPVTMTFTGLVLGRRYRYTVIVSNSIGSNTYTGIYDSRYTYNRLFVPWVSNSDGVTDVNTTSGK